MTDGDALYRAILDQPAHNVFVIKASYWLSR